MVKTLVRYLKRKYKKTTKRHKHYEKFRRMKHNTNKIHRGRSRKGGVHVTDKELADIHAVVSLVRSDNSINDIYELWKDFNPNQKEAFKETLESGVTLESEPAAAPPPPSIGSKIKAFFSNSRVVDDAIAPKHNYSDLLTELAKLDSRNKNSQPEQTAPYIHPVMKHLMQNALDEFSKSRGSCSNAPYKGLILNEIKKHKFVFSDGDDPDLNANAAYNILCEAKTNNLTVDNLKDEIDNAYRLKLIGLYMLNESSTLEEVIRKRNIKRKKMTDIEKPSISGGSKRIRKSSRRIKYSKSKKARTTRRLLKKNGQ